MTQHGTLPANSIATISPDGKYLFYTNKGDLYWVRAEIIANLKKQDEYPCDLELYFQERLRCLETSDKSWTSPRTGSLAGILASASFSERGSKCSHLLDDRK